MKINDEIYVHGYVDEIRKDTVIVRNDGGYFGTVESEIAMAGLILCKNCEHWDPLPSCTAFAENHRCLLWQTIATKENDFCSYAERRGGEE